MNRDASDTASGSGRHQPLDGERFAALIEAYGSRPNRWPEAERDAALALLASSSWARRLRDEAAALDALLDRATVPEVLGPEMSAMLSPGLADRIVATAPAFRQGRDWDGGAAGPAVAPRRPRGRARRWLGALMPETADWRGATALAASLAVGIAVGYLTPFGDGGTGWTVAEQQAIDAFSFGNLVSEDVSL